MSKSKAGRGAFILARYSTEHQKEDSIEVQVDACRAWCQKNGIPVLGVFADMGVSGMKRTRPEYSRMMEQLRAGMADTVVIYDQSRMFRRMSAWFDFRAEIDRLGVRVVSVTQTQIGGDLRDPAIFLMESSSAMFNQMWALQTRQKVVAKMRWMAQQGQFTGGVPPLGYKKEDGRLVIDEAEAAVVREIFALYADGVSYREITRRLNAEGHFTRSGRPFGSNSIHDLLRNVKYIGIMRYGNVVRDDDGHRNSHSHDGDVIEIEGAVPAIVDLKTWERVQAKMDENRRAQAGRPASVRDYPLKGKVFCLECGASMSVSCSTSHGKKHFYYRCSGRKRREDCDNSPIRCDTLEHRVAEVVRQILVDPENLNGLFAVLREERGQVQDNASARLAALSSRRGDLDAQIRNATDAILAGLNSPALAERLHCLEDERAQLEHDIKQLRGAVKGSEISEAALLETLRQIRNTPDGEAALLAAVVRVEVGKEEIRVWTLLDADPDGHFDFSSADDNGLVIKIPHVRPPAPRIIITGGMLRFSFRRK